MAEEVVTAAVFGDHTQAIAARLELDAAGIPAFVADEHVAGGILSLATAIGGFRLQVPASRLEESLRLLDERMPGGGGTTDWSEVDVGVPEPEENEDGEEAPLQSPAPSPTMPEPIEETLTLREQRAERLMTGVVIGIICFPVLFLAFWRVIQVFVSDERLRPESSRKAKLAGVLIVVGTTLWLMALCAGLGRAFY